MYFLQSAVNFENEHMSIVKLKGTRASAGLRWIYHFCDALAFELNISATGTRQETIMQIMNFLPAHLHTSPLIEHWIDKVQSLHSTVE